MPMGNIWYILASVMDGLIGILLFFMLIRAILSWVTPYPTGGVMSVLYAVTDFIIDPIRLLLERFSFVRDCPIDLSFSAAFLLLCLLKNLI